MQWTSYYGQNINLYYYIKRSIYFMTVKVKVETVVIYIIG